MFDGWSRERGLSVTETSYISSTFLNGVGNSTNSALTDELDALNDLSFVVELQLSC